MALTGAELDALNDEEFGKVVEKVKVYARVAPEHKLRIVQALKKGVAMGITGTDVTKEAADMVLADDNFATIVKAVEGGRALYDNIRKFTFFLMRSNFDELVVIGSFAMLGLELPLTASMILWINLVTDGAPAVALSKDPPADDVIHNLLALPFCSTLRTTFSMNPLMKRGLWRSCRLHSKNLSSFGTAVQRQRTHSK